MLLVTSLSRYLHFPSSTSSSSSAAATHLELLHTHSFARAMSNHQESMVSSSYMKSPISDWYPLPSNMSLSTRLWSEQVSKDPRHIHPTTVLVKAALCNAVVFAMPPMTHMTYKYHLIRVISPDSRVVSLYSTIPSPSLPAPQVTRICRIDFISSMKQGDLYSS